MSRILVAIGTVLAVNTASAQPIIRMIFSNDPNQPAAVKEVPGNPGLLWSAGTASNFDRPYGSRDGTRWAFGALAEAATTVDELIIVGGGTDGSTAALVAREGSPTPFDATRNWGVMDMQTPINNAGRLAFASNLSDPTADDEVIALFDGATFNSVIVREGGASDAFLAGTTYGSAQQVTGITSAGEIAGIIELDGGGLTTSTDNFMVITPSTILVQEGVTVPGNGTLAWQILDTGDFRIDADGVNWMAQGDDTGPTASDDMLVVNGDVVIREDSTVGAYVSPVSTITEPFMDHAGNWMARGNNDDLQDWVVRNGVVVAETDGDITPANPSGELYDDTIFSATFFVLGGNCLGDYIIAGTTNNPDPLFDAVVTLNSQRVILRQGDPIDANGNGLPDDNIFVHVFNNDDSFLTPDGLYYFNADIKFDNTVDAATHQAFLVVRAFCPGDIDRDGDVDQSDLGVMLSGFGVNDAGDTDCDGDTDQSDLGVLLSNFGADCSEI